MATLDDDFDADAHGSAPAGLDDDGFATASSDAQLAVEDSARPLLFLHRPDHPRLLRKKHAAFVTAALGNGLSRWFVSLDASRPWLLTWMLHSLDILGAEIPDEFKSRAVHTLSLCQSPTGGYGGGPGQIPHLATTYAAINAIAIVGTDEAYASVNRSALYAFLMSMKQPDGSFRMHEGGEIDVRGTYCALSAASLLGLMTPDLISRAAEFITLCQTFEGGFGGAPGSESHGGYAFCAFAAMSILGKTDMLDMDTLLTWTTSRQMPFEGGFQGRVNKLVDGCYSFWQGGIMTLLEMYLSRKHIESVIATSSDPLSLDHASDRGLTHTVDLYDRIALQNYILMCCQEERGGLRDKPGKSPDYYHTCYVLSGLSLAQHVYTIPPRMSNTVIVASIANDQVSVTQHDSIIGPNTNSLKPTHPVHNILFERVSDIKAYFSAIALHAS